MKKYIPAEHIELFHLYFLQQLNLKIDKRLYALKGGCNLRFFLKSIRYSQDIDIDIKIIRKDTLANHVRKILSSINMKRFLQANKIEIIKSSEPKQTETTQRWKMSLKSFSSSILLNTKIEFSRRGITDEIKLDIIDPLIASKYQFNPFFINHYSAKSAYKQKIKALIGRSETQARDVFDLFHLISLNVQKPKLTPSDIEKAQMCACSITFEEFKSQVVAYLPHEYHSQYSDPIIWENIIYKVVEEISK
ncbi:MAG: hypothetical protein K940chlam5_01267 [Candidatus Anoxychlamydiales bacterium]|nr:hypothetical protein [Candidatus Anoxychlamydiales bacterium]